MIFCNKEFLGKIFKKYRKLAKLTQEELSEKVDIAEKHYGKLERGIFAPSLETFFKLVDILNIPLSELGIQTTQNINLNKEKILQEIYSASDEELILYLNLIKSVKEYNKTKEYKN